MGRKNSHKITRSIFSVSLKNRQISDNAPFRKSVVSFPYKLRPNIASSLSPTPLVPIASNTNQTGIQATSGGWEPSWNPSRQKGRWPSVFIPCNTENNIDIHRNTYIMYIYIYTRKTYLILNKIGISIQKL